MTLTPTTNPQRVAVLAGAEPSFADLPATALVETLADGIALVDAAGHIQVTNAAWHRMFDLATPDVDTALEERIPGAWSGRHQVRPRTLRGRRPGAEALAIEVTVTPAATTRGPRWIVCAHDLQRVEALRHAVAVSRRFQALGRLAAGIAHEINTPSQFVSDNAHFVHEAFRDLTALFDHLLALARDEPGSPIATLVAQTDLAYAIEEVPRALTQSVDGIARLTDLVRALKEFAVPGGTTMVPADLNRGIDSTVTLSRNEWKYVAVVDSDLDATLPPVTCHVGELNQAVLNLLVHAAHAIAQRLGPDATTQGRIHIATGHTAHEVWVTIGHDGVATTPDHLAALTESNPDAAPGDGFADLRVVREVVVGRHAGHLAVASTGNGETQFTIRIPLTPAVAMTPDAPPPR